MPNDPKCAWCEIPCESAKNWSSLDEKAPTLVCGMLQRLYPEVVAGAGAICVGCRNALTKGIAVGIAYAKADMLDFQAIHGSLDPAATLSTRW